MARGQRACLVVCAICILFISEIKAQSGRLCTTPNGGRGVCKSIYNCGVLLNLVRSRDASQVRFLQQSQCGYDRAPLVCCGSETTYVRTTTEKPTTKTRIRNPLLPGRDSCGRQESDRIFGGTETELDEFPWMALLEYVNPSGKMLFGCGGALISPRYVLTAGHCVIGEIRRRLGRLVGVRLGEHDLRTQIDCISSKVCNKPPVVVNVEEVRHHSNYDPNNPHKYNDIALIRLVRSVSYSNYIRPICLPFPEENPEITERVIVAGWGKTENTSRSEVKLKVVIPVAEPETCRSLYSKAKIEIRNSQLCAGGEEGSDSCTGDSGGPLMATTVADPNQWYLAGIVSFGTTCGKADWPAVYTRVSDYLSWIYDNVSD